MDENEIVEGATVDEQNPIAPVNPDEVTAEQMESEPSEEVESSVEGQPESIPDETPAVDEPAQ